jgi:hypothetical protein
MHKEEKKERTILVTPKHPQGEEKKHVQGGGGVVRIPKKDYDPSKHNMASE